MSVPTDEPRIIQGGMGVAVSGWQLARAVARSGQLGVVSGTALEVVCARRLQHGDHGGDVRRALSHFPIEGMAERVLRTYYVPGGKQPDAPFRPVLRFSLEPAPALVDLTVVANFVEVFLAKEGHGGPIGINYLRKIELPIPFACYGAMLAGVDYVLMGAGSPAELPALLDGLARHEPVALAVRVQGATSADGEHAVRFDPGQFAGADRRPLRRPRFEAIVASVDLASGLAADPVTRPDGFVVEGHLAGGHNAPPRGPRRLDPSGQPVYDERDTVEPEQMAGVGLPFWMAGRYGTPDGLRRARADGACGVQVGTAFAFCRESGMAEGLRRRVLDLATHGDVPVRTDSRASPTGFPFKIVDLAGTLADEDVYAGRQRLCDLGVLRSPYRRENGTIGYRCPSEPVAMYQSHGGRIANTTGRRCLCNGLMATCGLAQLRAHGYVEPAIVTAGADFNAVRRLMRTRPAGQADYGAADVVAYLLGEEEARP